LDAETRDGDTIVKDTFSGHGILVKGDRLHPTNDDDTYSLILENMVTSVLKTDNSAHHSPKFLASASPNDALKNTKNWVNFFLGLLADGLLADPDYRLP
jgi:hypothetical protein